jgi:prepilin peptidase CpaA
LFSPLIFSEDIVEQIVLILGIVLFVVAACGDVKTLQIPNKLVIAVAALGLIRVVVIGDLSIALYTVGASFLVFIAAFLLFWRGFVGGGDAKLIAATALLVGYHNLFGFLVLMSLCGVLVTLAVLLTGFRGWRSQVDVESPEPQPKARLRVPYGVAIAGGGIVTLLFQPSLLG